MFGHDQNAFHIHVFFPLCSEKVLKMIMNCNKRIGSVGWKRLGEANTPFVTSAIRDLSSLFTMDKPEAKEEVSVNDSVESLWQLCCMLYRANLLTARYVVISYIEEGICNTCKLLETSFFYIICFA